MPRTQPFLHSPSGLPYGAPHDPFSPLPYFSSLVTSTLELHPSCTPPLPLPAPHPRHHSVLHPGTQSFLLKQDRSGPSFTHNPGSPPIPLRVKVDVPLIIPMVSHDLPPLISQSLSPATLPTHSTLAAAGSHPRAFAPAILSCTCLARSLPYTLSTPSGFWLYTVLPSSLP